MNGEASFLSIWDSQRGTVCYHLISGVMFVWRGISRTWLRSRWKSLGNRVFPSPQQQTRARAWTTSINPNNADAVFAGGSWIDVSADYITWRLSKATAAHLADCGPPNQARSPQGIELNASMTSNTPLNRPHGTDALPIRSRPSLCCRTSVRVLGAVWFLSIWPNTQEYRYTRRCSAFGFRPGEYSNTGIEILSIWTHQNCQILSIHLQRMVEILEIEYMSIWPGFYTCA